MKPTKFVRENNCPNCGFLCDCASHMRDESLRPRPGDFSICLYCGAAMIFNSDMTVRLAFSDELPGELRDEIKLYRQTIAKIRPLFEKNYARRNPKPDS